MNHNDLKIFLNANRFEVCQQHSMPDQGMDSRIDAFTNGEVLVRVVTDRGHHFIDLANIKKADWKSVFEIVASFDSGFYTKSGSFSEAISVLIKYWVTIKSELMGQPPEKTMGHPLFENVKK